LDQTIKIVLIVAVSYLFGSIPTAYLIARTKSVNIFEVGSGNMGATNVIRALGFWWGILVWALDSSKGIAAIVVSTLILPENPAAATAVSATAAVVGHNWSLFASMITGTLRGGKGAAIWFGTMLMIAPFQMILGICILGGVLIAITRYVSLAVMAMFSLSTLWMMILIGQHQQPSEYTFYSLVVTALMLYRFRENIGRLLHGQERRLGERA
jgi:glycerol-3-phosphate acyltransferase PlsY